MKLLLKVICLLLFSFLSAQLLAAGSFKIKKCKDADGKWHYGDTAAAACAKSTVFEIDDRGFKTGEDKAPPTKEQQKKAVVKEAERQRLAKIAAERKRQDRLLLSSYGSEKDIVYVRDRKLTSIDLTIKSSEQTKKSFESILKRLEGQAADEQRKGRPVPKKIAANIAQTREQIAEHEKLLVAKRAEREVIIKKYEADINRYRELKGRENAAKTATKE